MQDGRHRPPQDAVAQDRHEAKAPAGVRGGGRVGRANGVGRGVPRNDWCITARVKPPFFGGVLPAELQFAAGQQERGEGGFLHWQLFFQFKSRVRLHQVQLAAGDPTAHCEPRRGTPAEALAYVSKADTAVAGSYWEGGLIKGREAVNHMDALKHAMDEGADVLELMSEHWGAWTRAEKACDRYIQARDALRASKWEPARVELHWGASGSGKTRYCMGLIDRDFGGTAYRKPSGVWWDGYSRQACVLFDDFDATVPLDTLLQLLDGYGRGVLLPIKGSHINCWARTFLFTSNRPIDSWYPHATEEQRAGLRRRFSHIREYRVGDPLVKAEDPQVVDLTQEGDDFANGGLEFGDFLAEN